MVGYVDVQQHVTVVWQFAQALSPSGRHVQVPHPCIMRGGLARGRVLAMGLNGDAFGKSELVIGALLQWRVIHLKPSRAVCRGWGGVLTHRRIATRTR